MLLLMYYSFAAYICYAALSCQVANAAHKKIKNFVTQGRNQFC